VTLGSSGVAHLSAAGGRSARGSGRRPVRAAVGNAVGLDNVWAQPGAMPDGTHMPPAQQPALDSYFKQMMGLPSTAVPVSDANACHGNEELFQGLCYKSCKELTNGTFPLRTSSWTCCQAGKLEECYVSNQKKNFGLCSGYDVEGDGQSCPRAPGVCAENEEKFLGTCFEKCSILTNGTQPFRTSALTCCHTKLTSFSSLVDCLNPSKVTAGSKINVGGGAGDGDPTTPKSAHQPVTSPQQATGAVPVAN